MNASSPREALSDLKRLLEPLSLRYELHDFDRGLVAVIPVVGGVFLHPLTRASIEQMTVYGAGRDLVKILEPRFLRSLPRVPVAGVEHPSQLCAYVAKSLSERLSELGRIRDRVGAMGVLVDLERDVLRLSGEVALADIQARVTTTEPDRLTVAALGDRTLCGRVDLQARTLVLTGESTADLDALAKLVGGLDATIRRQVLAELEVSATPTPPPEAAPAFDWPAPPQPAPPDPQPPAEPETATRTVPEQAPVEEPSAPEPSPENHPQFAEDTSDVLELTEAVGDSPPQPPAPAAEPSLGSISLKRLFEKLGSDAEISAHAGRIRCVVPVKVIQGSYVFYLEQSGPTMFNGILQTPTGVRHRVEFDLREIEDIKEILDRVLMGP